MVLGIYGSGGHGLEVEELARVINLKENKWEKIIFIDDAIEKIDNEKIFSFETIINKYMPEDIEFMTGIGEPVIREKIYNKVKDRGYGFAILIHPLAYVAENVKLEEGVMIAYNAFISVKVHLSANSLIQPMASIHHECKIGRNSIVSSSVVMGGNSSLGDNSFIGIGAVVKQGINIGNGTVAGMGAVVVKDIPDKTMAAGNPAKIIKTGDIRVF
ncbi:MAG: NeuD/PglB/VioB family sugar acetyltransferase [Catonella sp.]